ncbi:MAG: hypothetical protein ACYDEB_12135 [Dehalococcoidia bacterium]
MTQRAARLTTGLRVPGLIRPYLYLARMVAVGLIAIGVSGAVCTMVRSRLGNSALAADQQSAYLSPTRCADLMEYHPEQTTCAGAEQAHHADEIVEYRLAAGVLGLLAAAAYALVRWRTGFSAGESRTQLRRYLLVATIAFGGAAAVLLGIGAGTQLGSGDTAPRWFADGGVALAFFLLHALWWARLNRAATAQSPTPAS